MLVLVKFLRICESIYCAHRTVVITVVHKKEEEERKEKGEKTDEQLCFYNGTFFKKIKFNCDINKKSGILFDATQK